MKMKKEPFSVKYISVQDSFLHFSQRWLEKLRETPATMSVLKLEYGLMQFSFFSASTESYNLEDDVIGVGATYAQKLGLKDNEQVTISHYSNVSSVSKISVSPVTTDDWDILEMTSDLIQSSLLDQIRVVWCDQTLVLWVSRSLCLSLHVDSLHSDCTVGILEPLTELIVSPAVQQVTSNDINLKQEHIQENYEPFDDNISNSVPNQPFSFAFWKSYISMGGKDPNVQDNSELTVTSEPGSVLRQTKQKPHPVILRVHPLCPPVSEDGSESCLFHPYNAFVRQCCLPQVVTIGQGSVICKLSRVPYPLDSDDTVNKHSSKREELEENKKSTSDTSTVPLSVYVQLIVIEDIYKDSSETLKKYLDTVTFSEKIGHNALLLSNVARTILRTKIGERVTLEFCPTGTSSYPDEIQITPVEKCELTKKELESLCKTYIAEQVRICSLIINSEAYIPIKLPCLNKIHVLIKLIPLEMKYALLNPDGVRRYRLKVKENTLDMTHPNFDEECYEDNTTSVLHISHFKKLFNEGVTTLELSLKLLPLVTEILPFQASVTSDNILILGTVGSGKSTLASAICREIRKLHILYIALKCSASI